MANLKEIKNRITSVSSTMQITQAMKLVSAAKLKRATDAITQLRPYAEKTQEILNNVSATLDLSENGYAEQREVESVLIIAVSSNRGLCGGFNNNIIKRVRELLKEYQGKEIEILSLGKKVNDSFRDSGFLKRDEQLSGPAALFDDLSFDHCSTYAEYTMDAFIKGKYDKVIVVYNEFKNAAVQIVQAEQFLPIIPSQSEEDEKEVGDYIFEPSKNEIVEYILPKSLKLQLFKAVLDSHASEHGARMTAMHKATDNATELQRELTLQYNKARQAAITSEILEIVGGAEALNG